MNEVAKTWRTLGTIFTIVAASATLYGAGGPHKSSRLAFALAAVFFALAGTGYLIDARYGNRKSRIGSIVAYMIAVSFYVIAAVALLTIL